MKVTLYFQYMGFRREDLALAGWRSWLERHPAHQHVVSLIPGQGTYLGCRFNPPSGCVLEATLCLCLSPLPLLLSLKINEHILTRIKKKKDGDLT